ncbi:MAG: AsmA family protein [Desulfurivibrionaceae bacterium]
MKTIIKILALIVCAVLLFTAGLSVFVHYYLTDERVKKLVIPKLENALAREVSLKDIQVSLWKGVTFKDFVILEADGEDEFVEVEDFNLSYDLLPLLKKQLKISRVVLNKPHIKVVRNADGRFNFESLKPLAAPAPEKSPWNGEFSDQPAKGALPLALTVKEIKVKKADFTLRDELEELPAGRAIADGIVGLETGKNLTTFKYSGSLDIKGEVSHEAIDTSFTGTTNFDQHKADFKLDLLIEDQEMTLSGKVKDYLEIPDITCNLDSRSLDLKYLLALPGDIGKRGEKAGGEKSADRFEGDVSRFIGAGIPEGLKARGQVRVDKAAYQNLFINDFKFDYELRGNVLHLTDISALTAEGRLAGKASVDLNEFTPGYNGTLAVRGVQLAPLQRNLFPGARERISGNLTTDFKFSGAGFHWPALGDTLNGEGSYKLLQGRINRIEVLAAIADLLQEKRLEDIHYEKLSGDFQVRDGDVMFEGSLSGEQVDASSEGMVGLDGELALPLELRLSPELSDRMTSKNSLSRYLIEKERGIQINLYLAGTLDNPEVSPDTDSAREKMKDKLMDAVEGRTGDEIDRVFDRDRQEKEEETEKKVSPEEMVNEFIKGVTENN